jgi:hypothetical protein
MTQQEDLCKCCGKETAPVFELTNKFIYNDFDLTGQEVDPIWCGEEFDFVGFKELCPECELKQIIEPDKDDLPF